MRIFSSGSSVEKALTSKSTPQDYKEKEGKQLKFLLLNVLKNIVWKNVWKNSPFEIQNLPIRNFNIKLIFNVFLYICMYICMYLCMYVIFLILFFCFKKPKKLLMAVHYFPCKPYRSVIQLGKTIWGLFSYFIPLSLFRRTRKGIVLSYIQTYLLTHSNIIYFYGFELF